MVCCNPVGKYLPWVFFLRNQAPSDFERERYFSSVSFFESIWFINIILSLPFLNQIIWITLTFSNCIRYIENRSSDYVLMYFVCFIVCLYYFFIFWWEKKISWKLGTAHCTVLWVWESVMVYCWTILMQWEYLIFFLKAALGNFYSSFQLHRDLLHAQPEAHRSDTFFVYPRDWTFSPLLRLPGDEHTHTLPDLKTKCNA